MLRTPLLAAALALAWALPAAEPVTAPAGTGPAAIEDLAPLLTPYLASHNLPALGAALVIDGRLSAAGVVGTRRAGTIAPPTLDDRFHLGSDSKAITALLAALLVERGELRWDITLGEVFSEQRAGMAAGVAACTLEQLLSHSSGMSPDTSHSDALFAEAATITGLDNLDSVRTWLVERWLREPLVHPPGTFAYANWGYVCVGAMIERRYRRTWEEVVRSEVYQPLGLASGGFGPTSTVGLVDAPLGHRLFSDNRLHAFLAGPNADNPPAIGPAGTCHLSLRDFAAWAGWNAGQGRRGPALVKPETMRRLMTPVVTMSERPDAPPGTPRSGRYGLGWGQLTFSWSPTPFVFHGGSNTLNLAQIYLQPERDWALVLVTNVAHDQATPALNQLMRQLWERGR